MWATPSRARAERGSRIQLAVSALGGLPGAQVYHSSVLVDGLEFSFGAMPGLVTASGALSHEPVGGKPEIFDLGFSRRSPRQLAFALGPYFKRGTYDLLRKNCNTFSDCAIFYLLGQRLDAKYRTLDQIGANFPGVVQMGSFGFYRPNRAADGFDADVLMQSFSKNAAGAQTGRGAKDDAAPGISLWEAAGHWLEAAGVLWAGCSQFPEEDTVMLEPAPLRREQLQSKVTGRAKYASSRAGGA